MEGNNEEAGMRRRRLTGRERTAGLMANCRFWILDESGASTRGNCFQDREQRRPILPNHIGAEMGRTVVHAASFSWYVHYASPRREL